MIAYHLATEGGWGVVQEGHVKYIIASVSCLENPGSKVN